MCASKFYPILFIISLVFVSVSSIDGSPTTAAPAEPLCSTPACNRAAQYFISAMNASANPCEDFYEYACGGWRTHHRLADDKSRSGTFDLLNEQMTDEIRESLRRINPQKDLNKYGRAVAYSAHLYQQCVAQVNASEQVGRSLLQGTIRNVLNNSDWTIGKLTSKKDPQNPPSTWDDVFANVFVNSGETIIFSISIQPDPKNVSANVVMLDTASLGLGEQELSNLTANAELINAYKAYIRAAAQFYVGAANIDNATLANDIEAIVQFESQLARIRLPVEEQRDPDKMYNKMSVKQFSTKTSFDWHTLFRTILNRMGLQQVPIHSEEEIVISDVEYFVKAAQLLSKIDARVVHNYIGWRLAATYGSFASEQYRKYAFEFNEIASGIKKEVTREEECESILNNFGLSMALSRLFVEKHFSAKEKQEAVVMIDSIQESFNSLLKKNAWLDDQTRKESLSKLSHVTKNVAYPTWLLNNTELDQYYGFDVPKLGTDLFPEAVKDSFVDSLRRFSVLQLMKSIIGFNDPIVIDKRWPMPPAIINAAYEPEQNSITIPAGILKSPFFDAERPYAINYGFVGVVIGHEFTHGLDDEGRKFDERGNLHDWWSPTAVKRFGERSECFVKEYSGQVDKTTGLHLNGRNTLGENIADNGGLHEAYYAMGIRANKTGKPSPRLADLPKISSEQLFFISFANTWCSLIRPEKLRQQIEYDPHSPAQFRVNVPLSNSAQFSQAFQCAPGTKMNPAEKCQLW